MEVKKGFKQTEVGVIPEDWCIVPVRSVGRVLTGNTPSTIQQDNYGADYMFVSPFDLGGKKYVSRTEKMLSRRGFSLARPLPRGTVLFVCIGSTIGKCGIAAATLATNQQINAIITSGTTNSEFLHYSLSLASNRIKSQAGEQAVPIVNKSQFAESLLPFPPTLAEQEAIAGALSDADAWIESLEQLIAKKRQIKQGAMQELLTGKRRLPGFSSSKKYRETEVGIMPDDWKISKVDSIVSEISMGPFGSDIKVSNFVSTGVPVLSGANVRSERLIDEFENFVTKQKARSLKKAIARKGDIVVTHRGTLGQISYIPDDSEFEQYVISQSQFRVRFDDQRAAPCWLVLYFQSDRGSQALLEKKGHTGVPAIAQPTTTFKSLYAPLPTVQEQRAIIEVVSDMNAEIESLESKLSKAREIKQGMMQELLTGRIRLI